MKEFAAHHNLGESVKFPDTKDSMPIAMAKIFDLMLLTMGEDKRDALIEECEKYYKDLPPSLR